MRLDWIRARPWAVAALLGIAGGAVGGAVIAPSAPASSVEPDAAWTLPGQAGVERRFENEIAQLRTSTAFFPGAGVTARAKWKLVGVTSEGDKRIALILVNGQSDLMRVSNGDKLPDDGQVVDVGRFGMRINIYGCENLILRLFTPGQRAPAPGCGYADDRDVQGVAGGPGARRGPGNRGGARQGGQHQQRQDRVNRANRSNRGNRRNGRPPGAGAEASGAAKPNAAGNDRVNKPAGRPARPAPGGGQGRNRPPVNR